jgi:hypothetical protein
MTQNDVYLDLYQILPEVDVNFEHYVRHEQEVISPALINAGYKLQSNWFDGERDSYGPLSRAIRTDKGTVVYA